MEATSAQDSSLGNDEMKLDETNSFGSNEIRIANTPIDGILMVQFSGRAAVVNMPANAEEALKAEQEGRDRINSLLKKIDKIPTAEEMNKLLINLKK